MIINVPQLDAFRQLRRHRFGNEMLEHIQTHFPEHFQVIPEPQLRATILLAENRAARYGLGSVRSVCMYLNSMLWLGSRFDTDLQYPWAQAILSDPALRSERVKADRLGDASVSFMLRLAGARNGHFTRLRERLLHEGPNLIDVWMSDSAITTARHCAAFFPEKWELLDAEVRSALVPAGKRLAARYGLHEPATASVYTIFMFLLGSGFDTDPQFGWAGDILQDGAFGADQKARALIRSGLAQLQMLN